MYLRGGGGFHGHLIGEIRIAGASVKGNHGRLERVIFLAVVMTIEFLV